MQPNQRVNEALAALGATSAELDDLQAAVATFQPYPSTQLNLAIQPGITLLSVGQVIPGEPLVIQIEVDQDLGTSLAIGALPIPR